MRDYADLLKRSVPEHLLKKEDFSVILNLIFNASEESFNQIDYLRFIFCVDSADPKYLPRLADTLKFDFPVDAGFTISHLRLFVKYYMEIRKIRGTIESIKKMVRLIKVTEVDICSGSFPNYMGVTVSRVGVGELLISYNQLVSADLEFVYKLLRKVVPAGHKYTVTNGSASYPSY